MEPTIITTKSGLTATLYCADCLAVLPALGKVDAVITDPPYGIGFRYESHDDTSEGYGPWLWGVIGKAEALCKPLSPVFVFQAMPNCRKWAEWFPRDWRIYAAAKNFVQIRPEAMIHAYDPVICWWTPGEGKPYALGTRNRDYFVANTSGVISNKCRQKRGTLAHVQRIRWMC